MKTLNIDMKAHIQFFFILTGIAFLAVLVTGCQYQGTTQSGSYKMLYDYQTASLHPQYIIYHHKEDSSRVYFRVKSDELLYTRTASDAPFLSKFRMFCKAYNPEGVLEDSVSITVIDQTRASAGWLVGHIDLKMGTGMHNLVLECEDLKKNTSQTNYLTADKQNQYSAQNFLLCDAHNEEPLFSRFQSGDRVIKIFSNRNASGELKVLHSIDSIYPPPPPFSTTSPELPQFTKATEEIAEPDGDGWLILMERGSYFITTDPEKKTGTVIAVSSEYFPEVKGFSQLASPIRYITTKAEYDEIRTYYFPKKKIDEFWVECGGSKERARDLIRIYYNRVEEANYYFSSYTEGWRTDRGMIHVVFGNPTRIVKQQTYETWIYGEEGQSGTLTFVFKKVESPNHPNVFILNRDPGFKQYWEKQVTAWRSGRIYNE